MGSERRIITPMPHGAVSEKESEMSTIAKVMNADAAFLRDKIASLEEKNAMLRDALEELTLRCDGEEGVRKDGDNIQTYQAHAVLEKTK